MLKKDAMYYKVFFFLFILQNIMLGSIALHDCETGRHKAYISLTPDPIMAKVIVVPSAAPSGIRVPTRDEAMYQ